MYPPSLRSTSVVSDLDHQVTALVQSGIAPNTRRTYTSSQQQFISFCTAYGLQPVPATESTILRYLAYLSKKPGKKGQIGLSGSSMSVYLSSLRSLHVMAGFPAPPTSTPRVLLLLKSVGRDGPPVQQKQPITLNILLAMCSLLPSSYDGLVWRAILSVAFYSAMRSSEYCQINHYVTNQMLTPAPVLSDIKLGYHKNEPYLSYTIHRSKTSTQPYKKWLGCARQNSHNTTLACVKTSLCPVCDLLHYLRARERHATVPLRLGDPLFQFSDTTTLHKQMLVNKIKHLVSLLGLDPASYSSHSIRAGSVSSAGQVKGPTSFQAWELRKLGNWSSQAYQSYLCNTAVHQLGFSQRIASTQNQ